METPVGVMAKAPEPGRVMTRLGESIGMERAARFYVGCLGWVLARLRESPFRPVLFYDPPGAEDRLRTLYGLDDDFPMVAQSGADLGERMGRALKHLHERYSGPAILVGSDCPDLPLEYLERAGERLGKADLVLGPADDGGYYLVGTTRSSPGLFVDMTWSRPDVLKRTLRRACEQGMRVVLLPVWRDLDTLEDLVEPVGPPG